MRGGASSFKNLLSTLPGPQDPLTTTTSRGSYDSSATTLTSGY